MTQITTTGNTTFYFTTGTDTVMPGVNNIGTGTATIGLPTVTAGQPVSSPGRPWSGPVAYEGQMTGDRRIFADGAISWLADSLPLPFDWVRSDQGGHDGAVTIGRVDNLYRDAAHPGVIFANGVILDGPAAPPEAAEYLALLEAGAAGGVSVDGDTAEFELVENDDNIEMHFSAMRLRRITAVAIPAFIGARITLSDAPAVAASADCGCDDDNHFTTLASSAPWDGSTGRFSDAQYQKAAAACAPGDEPVKQRCKLPHHDPGGALNINGLHAAAQRAGSISGWPPATVAAAKAHLRSHYAQVKEDPPDSIAAAVDAITAAAPVAPPAAWFVDPGFDGPTPMTVTADGRVYGHLALFGTCHIAMPNGCVTPPRDDTFSHFHTGEILTADGATFAVGHLTFATGHADMHANARAAAAHYDDTGTVAADVVAGNDAHGIWVAGALRPNLTDEQIREFRAAPLSGDWRRIGGRLSLVAALAVNVPGFPVPRARVLVASGLEQAVVATTPPQDFDTEESRRVAKARLANGIRKSDLSQRVGGQ
jgi:hypothetical protein